MRPVSSRRDFILRLTAVSAALGGGAALTACGGDDEQPEFLYGVASGDPLADRVILWTHARFPGSDDRVGLRWEVAEDAAFTRVVASGQATATREAGHTVKVDASGLAAGREYHYRFSHGGTRSLVGRTRTLPATASELSLAVMSCTNYPAGFFNVYAEVARSDAQFAIHLGDYIYEYPANGYASAGAAALGRTSVPANELFSLEDYRRRHAQYKSDADSKTLHARMPLIAVWDDHEIANDAYNGGAENHDPATEGSWAARRAAALQAHHEWMPIRSGADRSRIYRSFNFGNLVQLHMLDTRLVGRDEQISIGALAGLAGPAAQSAATAAYTSPSRQLLGAEQLSWLQGQLAASTATWQVLGQQVLMGRMEFPVSVLAALNSTDTSPEAVAAGTAAITAYLTAKATPPALRTPAQAALMNPALNPLLGYNLDAWDGYLAARETVLATVRQLGRKLVVLAGDTHNAWHSALTLKGLDAPALAGVKVGEEFATSSVSSPGLESYLPLPPAQVKSIFENVVDDLKWIDPSRRGFLKMRFTAAEAVGEWVFIDTITSRTYTANVGHTARYSG
ncbi:MAG: alkaline phosphatase D family protein [Betaproteobacteria bacterium]|jgi:alkaline phosphatase D|uniref:alkaline phosphatase D family protein n=1 Tax=Silanimonas sp. TaxID=1929290 RepID=UPI0022CAA645|nr:alkaline phosphatase D family protein [Silanimonas sp.]MCZ8165842.1 alkaline phosphatase D family protein [Silanimonas sp.]